MPLSTAQCNEFNSFLSHRFIQFDKKIERDRKPISSTYNGMYQSQAWESFTETSHSYDKMHVARPNDDGCWDAVDITNCVGSPCDPGRKSLGWGYTRDSYGKYHRDYMTAPLCFDQMRDTAMAVEQMAKIIEGLKKVPDNIISDFTRLFAVRSSDYLHIAGSAKLKLTTSPSMFLANCTKIDLGGTGNLPTSKLTMQYLNYHVLPLQMNGYFDSDFMIDGNFEIMTDMQTWQDNANANPALAPMYVGADFQKGGKYYAYGIMRQIGNWLFRFDETPLRFQHIGNGVLQRVQPFTNEAATAGLKPVFSDAYLNAQYQISHVYNRAARTAYFGETPSMGDGLSFPNRNLNGKWSWKNPDYFNWTDPNTGIVCQYNNDKHNKGYFLGEFEMGFKTVFPEIEMIIIHQIEPANVVNNPRCAAEASPVTQNLKAYNSFCGDA